MTGPRLEERLQLIVCDNDNLTRTLKNTIKTIRDIDPYIDQEEIKEESLRTLHNIKEPISFEVQGKNHNYEFTWVKDPKEVLQLMRSQNPPFYAAIIYNSVELNGPKCAKPVTDITSIDPSLPQIIYGKNIESEYVVKALKAGCKFFHNRRDKLRQTFNEIFKKPKTVENLTVIKIGGSSFDYDRESSDEKTNLDRLCKLLSKFNDSKKHRFLVTVGAGQFGEVIKDHQKKYGYSHLKEFNSETIARIFERDLEQARQSGLKKPVEQAIKGFSDRASQSIRLTSALFRNQIRGLHPDLIEEIAARININPKDVYNTIDKAYPDLISKVLQLNLEMLSTHFDQESAYILKTGAFYVLRGRSREKKIPLISIAPHYILARDKIPLQDSDTHTIALAEFYGVERVVLVKRTDGLYKFDPYRGFSLNTDDDEERYGVWQYCQEANERYEKITIDQMLDDTEFSREGTDMRTGNADGSNGHLMEDSALEYMKGCKKVKEIVIAHIAPEEMYYPTHSGEYKHVVTKETLPGDTHWELLFEERLSNAIKGIGSKIVR